MRFKTVDGLRGIAALAVVCYHLSEATTLTYGVWAPAPLAWLFQHGFLGVDIFFVISGFVIAYSVRDADLTFGFIGRFALRRSIRLDPPYWVAIAVETGLIWIGIRTGLANTPLPSLGQIGAHLLYLQNLLGLGNIVDIFWTLCFEIQFYLGLILLLVVGGKLERWLGSRASRPILALSLGSLFIYSLMARYHVFGLSAAPGFAVLRWYQFFLGVMVWWVVSGRCSWGVLPVAWLLTGTTGILAGSLSELLPIGASALLWWSYRRDRMASALGSRPVQFLGLISYSLYLFHASIGWRLIRVSGLIWDGSASRWLVAVLFLGGVGFCVFAGWVAWALLERPALAFSRRVGLSKRSAAAADGGGVAAGLVGATEPIVARSTHGRRP